MSEIASMTDRSKKKYRWDRIGLVLGGMVLFSFGLAAWVAPEEALDAQVLSHPQHNVTVQGPPLSLQYAKLRSLR